MAVTREELLEFAANLRASNPVKSEITEEFRRNLDKCSRQDILVDTSYGPVPCSIFTAKRRSAHCPLFINVHGGGFVRPHLERDSIMAAMIADAIGGMTLDIDYHLAPEYPYPAAVNEVYEIACYAFSRLQEWDVDEKRVSMGGYSAGATISAAAAIRANETGAFRLCLLALCYGCFEMFVDPADKPGAADNLISSDRGRAFNLCYCGGNEELLKEPLCSPAAASDEQLKGLPETLVISAGKDNFRFEDTRFADRLALLGVKVTMQCFTESNHGFMTHCSAQWREAQKLLIDCIRQASLV